MALEDIGKKLKSIGNDAKEGLKKTRDTAALNSELNSSKERLKKLYFDLGRKTYAKFAAKPIPGFENEFNDINAELQEYRLLKQQLEQQKTGSILRTCSHRMPWQLFGIFAPCLCPKSLKYIQYSCGFCPLTRHKSAHVPYENKL